MNISRNKYFAGTILTTQSIGILSSNCSVAKQFKLSVKDYVFKEEEFEKCISKIKAEDTLEITFESSNGQFLNKNLMKGFIEDFIVALDPCFFVFDGIKEYLKGNAIDPNEEEIATLEIKFLGDFSDLVENLLKKYNSISSLRDFRKFLSYCSDTFYQTHLNDSLEIYRGKMDIIRFLFGDNIVDMSCTRDKIMNVDERILSIYNVLENIKNENVKKAVSGLVDTFKFYKKVIASTIQKAGGDILEGDERDGSTLKFKVPNDPTSFDLIKYILTMEDIKSSSVESSYEFLAEDIKSSNLEGSYKFLLEKFILYMFTSKSKIAGDSDDLVEDNFCEKSWKENKEKELFGIWLDLKDRKDTVSVAARKLVKFLKKYLKEDELQTIKDKFLGGHISAKFKEVFEENEVEEDLQEDNGNSCIIM